VNLPNKLTIGRLILTAIFVAVVSIEAIPQRYSIGLVLFGIAAFTDFLDGYLARKHGLITNFGKLMDPLADKVLMCSAFVILARHGQIPAWVVIALLSREFLVTGLRLLATSQGRVLAADSWGKLKTFLQIVLAIYLLLFLASSEAAFEFTKPLFSNQWTSPELLGVILIATTALVTIFSGIGYMIRNSDLFRGLD
jgi:CDP-diacylglycerol--glycerol-3-phosphate 3-phosphatidyltransferase